MTNPTPKDKGQEKILANKIEDFMPGWAKEEKCFKEVTLREVRTKKLVEGGMQLLEKHNYGLLNSFWFSLER
jgi:hypothetical protein